MSTAYRIFAATALLVSLQALTASPRPVTAAQSGTSTKDRAQTEYRGFRLLNGTCNVTDLTCHQRGPRSWKRHEIESLHTAIDDVLQRPLGSAVVRESQRHGADVLQRYALGTENDGTISHIVNAAFHSPSSGRSFIEMTDRFFEKGGQRDQRAQYLLQTRIFLHELFHAIDDQGERFSMVNDEFASLIGLVHIDHGWRRINVTESEEQIQYDVANRIKQLLTQNQYEDAWNAGRVYATRPEIGLPSMRALDSPAEAFAEIGAHLLLDPTVATYLKPQVTDYFRNRVFPTFADPRKPGL
jgi:hypothetical protein